MDGVRFLEGEIYFSLLHTVQTESGAHPASCPMDSGLSFPGGKATGREANHSPPSSVDVKNYVAIPPLPHVSSWCSASLIKHRDNFTLYLPLSYYEVILQNWEGCTP
jgi:hypothetical protein